MLRECRDRHDIGIINDIYDNIGALEQNGENIIANGRCKPGAGETQ